MKKILIADDSLFMRIVLKNILSNVKGEYKILEAESGAKTLDLCKKEEPDLILLDIIMPESEEAGIHVLEALMKINPEMKVIMISAVGQDLILDRCKELGAKDYIIKPFDEKLIIRTVKKYLGE